jgi:glucose-1-phosphate cytidylyltransferase
MKTVILAGGLGTRLSEETKKIPKPMVKLGGLPIILHIINYYKKFGYNEFIIGSGYKRHVINNYFIDAHSVDVINTGIKNESGSRLKKIKNYFKKDEDFFMTYGDGLSNINLKNLLKFHKKHKKIATLSAVRPLPRFGHLTIKGNKVVKFKEKDILSEGWINGGFFVLNSKIFNYIDNSNNCIFEKKPLESLSKNRELMAYKHEKFWHPMDTLRDKNYLNDLLKKKEAPWLK